MYKFLDEGLMELSVKLGDAFNKHYSECGVYVVQDVPGEDHIFALDEMGKPMFDMLVSTARKFTFIWYYIHPSKGLKMVDEMKRITLRTDRDFVMKYPNIPIRKAGHPSIIRYGKHEAGQYYKKLIVKGGNPQLENKVYTAEDLNTYRNYEWYQVPNAFELILIKAKAMALQRLGKHQDKAANIRGYVLYAGCAYSMAYPQLGFGMRDIDVEVMFSPDWYTNTRAAYTHNCGIAEFGTPKYFGGNTRFLDLMWNSWHSEEGTFQDNVVRYMNEMRKNSDRWATISQRPMFNLETRELLYTPAWIQKLNNLQSL